MVSEPRARAARRLRVAVAEDDDLQRDALQDALEQEGFEVVSLEDGSELMDYFGLPLSQWADVVVADVNMPGCSGLDGLALARQRGLTIPIFVVSGEPAAVLREQVERLGSARFFPKPVDLAVLTRAIREAIR